MSAASDQTTLDRDEIARFDAIADQWWDPRGKFAPLHAMNPTRIGYIRDAITGSDLASPSASVARPLDGLRIADIGCGGGLLSEPLARMGATVFGADASQAAIAVARHHAAGQGLEIDYRETTAEALAAEQAGGFDVVTALEIVEHVADVDQFMAALATLLRPGGRLFLSTLNRTQKSFAVAIIGAEYIARLLPRGTHDWRRFLTPEELSDHAQKAGLVTEDTCGMVYLPLSGWRLDRRRLAVNYLLQARLPD
ncbi:MAG: bifunctional 2-polyprenyl-6-hydroxyphenol methylase/3-demethylubiquinol 3-O-methyltransferase UbiG [Pseudomonadota bacterium]